MTLIAIVQMQAHIEHAFETLFIQKSTKYSIKLC